MRGGGHLSFALDHEPILGAHVAGEDAAKQHERPAFDRVTLLDEMILEFDHQRVEVYLLSRQSDISGGTHRFAGIVDLGEPDGRLQVATLILGLTENLDSGSPLDMLQNL